MTHYDIITATSLDLLKAAVEAYMIANAGFVPAGAPFYESPSIGYIQAVYKP